MFPQALSQTYCVPPVHLIRLPYSLSSASGQMVLVSPELRHQSLSGDNTSDGLSHVDVNCLPEMRGQESSKRKIGHKQKKRQQQTTAATATAFPEVTAVSSVYDSDLRDDFAQQHVLIHLQEMASQRDEVMFILSQLLFSDYLRHSSYAAALEQLPKPTDLDRQHQHGEFDIILIHRHYGILIGELKSVGISQADFRQTEAQADVDLKKRVMKAAKQLNRSEKIIRYLIHDIVPGLQLTVRKTIFLPYISRDQLRRVITADPSLEKAVCQCLGAVDGQRRPDREQAVLLCMCSEQLSDPKTYWHLTPTVMARMHSWWENRMSPTNTQLDDRLYLEIVSRFVGPASSKNVLCVFSPPMEIKTDWQAISELGRRLSCLALTPKQMELLSRVPRRLCVTGPPGTGKSIVLVLMGLQWLLEGHDVHVVSVFYKSLAASQLVAHQLRMTLKATQKPNAVAGRVYFHKYNFWDKEEDEKKALEDLLAAVDQHQQLYVIMDEAWFGYRGLSECYQHLVSELVRRVPSLYLWAADVGNINIPEQLERETFTVPLRYCSTVLREVEEGISLYNTVIHYTTNGLPAHSDGPRVIRLHHAGDSHSGCWPVQCFQCGLEVATVLYRLNVGRNLSQSDIYATNSPPPLQFRDVFILTRSSELQDNVYDNHGNMTSRACMFVQGLRASGVPACVLNGTVDNPYQWEKTLADVSVGKTDWVTVAHLGALNGLERKVVVWLPGRMENGDDDFTDEAIEALDRLASVSRCTTQLIIVHIPPGKTKPQREVRHSQCVLS